jgi:HAD superfamily hydrolase (TIGR01509 family)
MIKSVLFDMDGVLIDAREWHYLALNQALEFFGFEITREEHDSIYNGLSTKQKLNLLTEKSGLPKALHSIIENTKQDRTLRIAAEKCYPNLNHLILLSRIKKLNIKIGLVSNSIRNTCVTFSTYSQILPYLDVIVSNEDVERPKPSPEGYMKACEILKSRGEETLVVEDGEYGIAAAKSAGCLVAKVSSPEEVNLDKLSFYIPELLG